MKPRVSLDSAFQLPGLGPAISLIPGVPEVSEFLMSYVLTIQATPPLQSPVPIWRVMSVLSDTSA